MKYDLTGNGSEASRRRHPSDGPASASAAPAAPSPRLVRGQRATATLWRRLEAEFGLLTSAEVAEQLGVTPTDPDWVSAQRKAHKIIGVRRGAAYRYPGFQFDRGHQAIVPVIEPLFGLASANAWTSEDLTLWMVSPTTEFTQEDRPVDHLQEPEAVMAVAKLAMEADW